MNRSRTNQSLKTKRPGSLSHTPALGAGCLVIPTPRGSQLETQNHGILYLHAMYSYRYIPSKHNHHC